MGQAIVSKGTSNIGRSQNPFVSKAQGFFASTVSKLLDWAQSNSLWYTTTSSGGGCCADELFNLSNCRYDIERFGSIEVADPAQADLLIITSAISYKAVPMIQNLYREMLNPKYVISVGSCANCGGPYSPEMSYSIIPGVDRIIPVDVYIPGCPPRPEAIMNGIIALQEKIRGN